MAASKNQRVIIEELARVGLEPHAIAGILANLEHENGFRTTVNNGDGGQASGIAQWHPDRFARVIRIAKKMGVKPTDIRAQARTLALSIVDERQSGRTGTTTVESLNALGSPAAVAKFFDENYERSTGETRQSRMNAAKNYMKMSQRFAGGGAETAGETPKVPGSSGGTMTWVPKVGNQVSRDFTGPGNYKSGNHSGVDIPGNQGGQPIRWAPPVTGKVIGRGLEGGGGKGSQGGAYGNHVIVKDEKGRTWLLAHMQTEPPKVGTVLRQGDMIGRVGATGNADGAHLHIEMTAKNVDYRSGGPVKRAKLVFKVGPDGQVYDKDFKPTSDEFLDQVGLSGEALDRAGNEELKRLVDEAIANEWTAQEFTRQFKASKWYRKRAESQRTFDMKQDTDQQQEIAQAQADARSAAERMGVTLTDKQLRRLAVLKARDGFSDQQVQWWIGRRYKGDGDQSGMALAAQESLKTYARDYGVRIDTSTLNKWTQEVLQSGKDVSSYVDNIRDIAATQNPYLRDAYQRGLTTREALQSYINTAAQLMGKTEDEIDMSDPKWRKVFDVNGNPLSDAQWQRQVKSQAEYGYGNTQNAINEARMHGRNLMRVMGAFSG